jgi:hypothetical protein
MTSGAAIRPRNRAEVKMMDVDAAVAITNFISHL